MNTLCIIAIISFCLPKKNRAVAFLPVLNIGKPNGFKMH